MELAWYHRPLPIALIAIVGTIVTNFIFQHLDKSSKTEQQAQISVIDGRIDEKLKEPLSELRDLRIATVRMEGRFDNIEGQLARMQRAIGKSNIGSRSERIAMRASAAALTPLDKVSLLDAQQILRDSKEDATSSVPVAIVTDVIRSFASASNPDAWRVALLYADYLSKIRSSPPSSVKPVEEFTSYYSQFYSPGDVNGRLFYELPLVPIKDAAAMHILNPALDKRPESASADSLTFLAGV